MQIEIIPTLAGDWFKFTPFTPEDFDVEKRPAEAKSPDDYGLNECHARIVLRLKDHVATQVTSCAAALSWTFVGNWLGQIVSSVRGGGYEVKPLSVGRTASFTMRKNTPDDRARERIADAVAEANSLFDDVPSVVQQRVDKLNEAIQIGVENYNAERTKNIERVFAGCPKSWVEIADKEAGQDGTILNEQIAELSRQIEDLQELKTKVQQTQQKLRCNAFRAVLDANNWLVEDHPTPEPIRAAASRMLADGLAFRPRNNDLFSL